MLQSSRRCIGHVWRSYSNAVSFTRKSSTDTSLNTTSSSCFRIGDRILLSWLQSKEVRKKLSQPLQENGSTTVDNYEIPHIDLINQPSQTYIQKTSKDGLKKINVLAKHPSLDDFTSLSRRRVAPIYSAYASTIVDLLDIHVQPPTTENDPKSVGPSLEILEAGTGHGSLTLHLSRAISGANLAPPSEIPNAKTHDVDTLSDPTAKWKSWQATRRAILHTIDIDQKNSEHASNIIRSFRSGIYWPYIDFHVGSVRDWLIDRASRNEQVNPLDAIVLDMPNVHHNLESAATCLKLGGRLLVFTPQITQIAQCVQEVKNKDLPLIFDGALELGEGISTGRVWDVRIANIRAEKAADNHDPDHSVPDDTQNSENSSPSSPQPPSSNYILPMVCRPRVFERTRGGGFVGIWDKKASRAEKQKPHTREDDSSS